jgi:hypothetical protein
MSKTVNCSSCGQIIKVPSYLEDKIGKYGENYCRTFVLSVRRMYDYQSS